MSVNRAWPEELPLLTAEEALSVAKRLYRFGMKRAWKGKWALTSGRRYTWPRRGVYFVNPVGSRSRGWRDLVHEVSHYVHSRRYPGKRGHDIRHEILEREMVDHVVRSGWLDGRFRKAQAPSVSGFEKLERKLAHAQQMLSKAETRAKRAATLRKKWSDKVRYYERETLKAIGAKHG